MFHGTSDCDAASASAGILPRSATTREPPARRSVRHRARPEVVVAPAPARLDPLRLTRAARAAERRRDVPVKVRYVALAMLAALALAGPATSQSSADAPIVEAIDQLRSKTNDARERAGRRPLPTTFLPRAVDDVDYRRWVQAVWTARLDHARRLSRRSTVWDRLAECETGGNWRHRNSTYQGGLGFYHGSWDAYRPRRFPHEAYLATREEQITVGKRIKADVGWGAWPACSIRLGLR